MVKVLLFSIVDLYQWRKNPRIICVFLLALGYIYTIIEPIKSYASQIKTNCSPWILPFITSNADFVLILMLLFVVLVCDAPFLNSFQPYMILRSGKSPWIVGQIIYISMAALIYWVGIFLFCFISLLPTISLSNQWGTVLQTLAQTRAGSQIGMHFSIDYKIILNFSPVKAFLISLLLAWMVSVFIGLLIMCFNIFLNKSAGVIAAIILIFSQHFAYLCSGYWFYNISPISWISMSILNFSQGNTRMPSFDGALVKLLVLITILVVVIIKKTQRNSIDLISI